MGGGDFLLPALAGLSSAYAEFTRITQEKRFFLNGVVVLLPTVALLAAFSGCAGEPAVGLTGGMAG